MKSVRIFIPGKDGQVDLVVSPAEAASFLLHEGLRARCTNHFACGDIYFLTLAPLQLGGKGGFGKLLKSQKHLGKNTTNFDSCRDLDGKKLKYANRDAKIESLKKKAEQDDDKKTADVQPVKSAVMLDEAYIKQLTTIREAKRSAVEAGIVAAAVSSKIPEPAKKLKSIALFDDDEDSE